MTEVFIAGVSMTRFGPQPGESINSLSTLAVRQCLNDAGAKASQLGAVYFANAAQGFIESKHGLTGRRALQGAGIEGLPVVNVEYGCASASAAFWLARNHVQSGQDDLVLAIGTEKMVFNNTTLSQRAQTAFEGPGDVTRTENILESLCAHMSRFGTTQRQLALIASKNHANSVSNPKCKLHHSFTVDQILEAPPLHYPMTVPMSSFWSDGSAAALLASANGIKKLKAENKAIREDSCVLAASTPHNWEDFENHPVSRAASRAYARAGIGPEDDDLAEIHDADSFSELFMTELLGFCVLGSGGQFAESGATMLKGRLPVNPSGGLQSKGHPLGATGLGQIYELVMQLRRQAGQRQVDYARVAVQENGSDFSGVDSTAVVTVLSR